MNDGKLIDLQSAATLVGVSRNTLQLWWENGDIPEPTVKYRKRYFTHEAVQDIRSFRAALEAQGRSEDPPRNPLARVSVMDACKSLGLKWGIVRQWALTGKIPLPSRDRKNTNRAFSWTNAQVDKIKEYSDERDRAWLSAVSSSPSDNHKDLLKVKGRGWVAPGDNPDVQWVSKTKLVVPDYHRVSSNHKVLCIAREWDWALFGVITVNFTEDRGWSVVDGAKRLQAAMRREDITELPIVVVNSLDRSSEVRAYIHSNDHRDKLTAVSRFQAKVEAKDEPSLQIAQMLMDAGRTVSSKNGPKTLKCISLLEKLMRDYPDSVRAVWGAFTSLCEGKVASARILKALVLTETRLKAGVSMAEPSIKLELLFVGYSKLLDSLDAAVKLYGTESGKALVEGVVQAVNKGKGKPLVLASDQ